MLLQLIHKHWFVFKEILRNEYRFEGDKHLLHYLLLVFDITNQKDKNVQSMVTDITQ